LDTCALAKIQNKTGGQIPMDKFTLNTAINALRNVKNETITTRQIYDYEAPTVRYIPAPTTRKNTPITVTSPPKEKHSRKNTKRAHGLRRRPR
jgi:hypothetical protein